MDKVIIEQIKKCTSYSEVARIVLGIDYYNGSVKEKVINICEKNGIDISKVIAANKNKKNCCLQCGRELKRGQKKFCSLSCSATYNNLIREHSEETKRKISDKLLKIYESQGGKHLVKEGSVVRVFECTCKVCGKHYWSRTKNSKHCSPKCVGRDPEVKNKLKEKQIALIESGKHKGWQTRNIKSYAERFWEEVLKKNNIEFLRETHNNGKYFIDFEIRRNNKVVDLEIDGKQHTYKERIESDKKRDSYLADLGYIVYRIEWNEINTIDGKKLMKDKIDAFMKFYTSL